MPQTNPNQLKKPNLPGPSKSKEDFWDTLYCCTSVLVYIPSKKLNVALISFVVISIEYTEVVNNAWLAPTANLERYRLATLDDKIAMTHPMM